MIDQNPEPYGVGIDLSTDSARLISNGQRVKCVTIMDVTVLEPEQQQEFARRSMAALTRMGNKLPKKKG